MKVQLSGVSKAFGAQHALREIDLELDQSVQCLVLIGPSGGGKSTLLRVLGGLESPDAGTVSINGEPLAFDQASLLCHRRRNGFLFQSFNLFPHITAVENVALPLEKVHGVVRDESVSKAQAALERFGLREHGHKRPSQLSGGQQQRVGLARAVAHEPRLLILDEPTSALDPEMTAEVLDFIDELRRGGQEIILSTHEMGFARAAADEVVFLADGKLVESGSAEQLFGDARDNSVQRFLSRVMRW